MKLLATAAEMKALRTICSDNTKVGALMMGLVREEHFYYAPAKAAYRRIKKLFADNGAAPDWSDLVSDPKINEDARKLLRSFKEGPLPEAPKVNGLFNTLDHYRKLRALVSLTESLQEQLQSKEVDLDELLDNATTMLSDARVAGANKAVLYNLGRHNNSTELMRSILFPPQRRVLPTGFKAFDSVNGGLLEGSLMVIGANTGGGKTTMGINLLRNMTEFYGASTVIVPFEMTAAQTAERLAALRCGVPLSTISQGKLTKKQRHHLAKSHKEFVDKLKAKGTRWSIWEPQEDLSIEEVLLSLKPYNFDVILIDYISLLKGADGDDQWRALSAFARYAKVFAKNNNCRVILLCQVTDEGLIRYSRGIAEHANNAWVWTSSADYEETSIYDVRQLKARNQKRFTFQLLSHNDTTLITDVEDQASQEPSDEEDTEKPRSPKAGQKSRTGEEVVIRKSQVLEDLNDGDEDE